MKIIKFMLLVFFMPILALGLLLDYQFGLFTNWTVLISFASIAFLLTFWNSHKLSINKRVVVAIFSFLLIFSVRYWDYNSLKPFLRTLGALEKGMSKNEVINNMSDYNISGQGKGFIFLREKEAEPELDGKVEFINFTHTQEGWGDSDWGFVYFIDNKLYRTGFSPD